MLNTILLLIFLISILPLVKIKKLCATNKGKLTVKGIVFLVLIHAVLPTFILTVIAIAGTPMAVVSRFAPDIFIVQIVSSAILYFVGAFKVIYSVYSHRNSAKIGELKK